jgi:chemotaxis family two-component system response regulator Rcp1
MHKTFEVLVVQSDPANAHLIATALDESGSGDNVRTIRDDVDALAYIRKQAIYTDASCPDLIVLGPPLAEISGLDVLGEIKAIAHLKHAPVVVVSGSDNPDVIRAIYELGRTCFIRKPSDLTEFLRFVRACYESWGNIPTPCRPSNQFQKRQPSWRSVAQSAGRS